MFEEAPRCPQPYAKNCNLALRRPGIHYEIYPTGKRIQSFNTGNAFYERFDRVWLRKVTRVTKCFCYVS